MRKAKQKSEEENDKNTSMECDAVWLGNMDYEKR